jgi:deoxyribodipyrimidine photolyase-related protein
VDRHQPYLWHSLLSPLINLGLLTPVEVVERVMAEPNVPLASREGFIRQIVGWREFIYQIYIEYQSHEYHTRNSLGHHRRLNNSWYKGTTGLLPLDETIRGILRRGWCHHIERLMVVGSAMVMAEVHPDDAYRWFLELFVDSGEWVMIPNVYGMSQFADGGFFATKPYVSGSAYLRKMTNYPVGAWCEVWDGLYWNFISHHQQLFIANPRMSMMVRQWEKMSPAKQEHHQTVAKNWIKSVTLDPSQVSR